MTFRPRTYRPPGFPRRRRTRAARGLPGPVCDPEEGYPLWERVVVALAAGAAPTLAGYLLYKFDPSVGEDED